MSIPNKDEVQGKYDQAKGKVKQAVGDLTGNEQTKAEGQADEASGDTQQTWGKVKHGVSDTVDAVGDAISDAGKKINKG